jgi:methylase of polypeptide subunit release factors
VLAREYQRRTELFAGWRELLVRQLAPRRGDTVLDVGCGTGLNFAALRAAVGPEGTIVAIEESPGCWLSPPAGSPAGVGTTWSWSTPRPARRS